MQQFDVYENANPASRADTPYLVIIQSEVSTGPHSVIVAPLVRKAEASANDRIVVPAQVGGEAFVVLFQAASAIQKAQLQKRVGTMPELRDKLSVAIDYLFLGF